MNLHKIFLVLALIGSFLAGMTQVHYAQADSLISTQGNLTSTGNFNPLYVQGQATCSVVLTGNAASYSVTAQGSSDYGATENTLTSFGSSGIITSNGTYTANILAQSNGSTTLFMPKLTAIASGTLHYVDTCTSGIGSTSGGGGSYPSPAPTDPNGNVKTAIEEPTDSSGRVNVVTPAPQATLAPTPCPSPNGSLSCVPVVNLNLTPCNNPANTMNTAIVNISTATTTSVITGSSGKVTYLCSGYLMSAGTVNVTEESGASGACSSLTALTGALAFSTSTIYPIAYAPIGTDANYCLVTSAAIQVSGRVSYVQQ
jgi:hypothetical protein